VQSEDKLIECKLHLKGKKTESYRIKRIFSKRRNTMKSSTKDKVESNIHKMKGEIKEIAGKLSNNPDLEIEGKEEKIEGKVQEKVGQIKKVFGK
jgi:uncharacterized protein YjbJ (UPF0337 family)